MQQRLKDFDYSYNPLKRDLLPLKSYHIVNGRRKPKAVGPPTENNFLKSFKIDLNSSSFSNSLKSKEPVSILKSLLDDSPNNTSFKDDSVVAPSSSTSFNCTLDGFARFCIGSGETSRISEPDHRKCTKRRKFVLNKSETSSKYPVIEKYDAAVATIDCVSSILIFFFFLNLTYF